MPNQQHQSSAAVCAHMTSYMTKICRKSNQHRTTNHFLAISGLSDIVNMSFIVQEIVIRRWKVVDTIRSYNIFNDTHDSLIVSSSRLTNDDTAWHLYKVINSRHTTSLTLSSPVVSNGYTSKYPGAYWSNPPFLICDILALWRSGLSARVPECQKI